MFLLFVNDMKEAVNCYLFLNTDDSCLIYQHSDISKIEQNLNKIFSNIYDWYKLSFHFGEDKTKCVLFCTKQKINETCSLDIRNGTIQIK